MALEATTIRTLLMNIEGRKPTIRQVRAVENLVENGGVSKGEAIRKADYSEVMTRNPNRVFGSPLIQKVLEKLGMPDESQAIKTLKRNLNAKKNPIAQVQAADKILRVFGAYAPNKVVGKHAMSVGVMSMRELREKMREAGESIV